MVIGTYWHWAVSPLSTQSNQPGFGRRGSLDTGLLLASCHPIHIPTSSRYKSSATATSSIMTLTIIRCDDVSVNCKGVGAQQYLGVIECDFNWAPIPRSLRAFRQQQPLHYWYLVHGDVKIGYAINKV